jgi:hypothetical protein
MHVVGLLSQSLETLHVDLHDSRVSDATLKQ